MRKGDQGTAYAAALQREKGNIRNCDDAAAMAGFLEGSAQLLLGAVSPRLIWEGAQHLGLASLEVAYLIQRDPSMAMDLMWVETGKPAPPGLADKVRAAAGGQP